LRLDNPPTRVWRSAGDFRPSQSNNVVQERRVVRRGRMSTTLLKGVAQLPHRFRGHKQGYLSNASRTLPPSRNEVRAPNSACTRSSSGVQRALSNAQTGETVTPVMGVG